MTFPFTSESKRMGIVLKNQSTDEYFFFLKGADSVMQPLLKSEEGLYVNEKVSELSRQGLRTLVITKRKLDREFF